MYVIFYVIFLLIISLINSFDLKIIQFCVAVVSLYSFQKIRNFLSLLRYFDSIFFVNLFQMTTKLFYFCFIFNLKSMVFFIYSK